MNSKHTYYIAILILLALMLMQHNEIRHLKYQIQDDQEQYEDIIEQANTEINDVNNMIDNNNGVINQLQCSRNYYEIIELVDELEEVSLIDNIDIP